MTAVPPRGPGSPRRVALVTTGGTIASVAPEGRRDPVAALSAPELLAGVGDLEGIVVEPVVELARSNSWDVDPALMWGVAGRVRDLVALPEVSGVVVTHGTDTVEETAFVTDLSVGTDKPVVFAVAMRAADELSADGPRNLRAALRAAAASGTSLGATVCLGDELHAARWVRKVHSRSMQALASPGHAPVAQAGPDGVWYASSTRLPRWPVSWPVDVRSDDVPLVAAYTGLRPDLLDAVVHCTQARGLVLEGFGLGNLPGAAVDAVERLVAQGVVVVVATRTLEGGVWPVYGGRGGGADLRRAGVVAAGELSAAKARLLLLACLSGVDAPTARARFEQAVVVLGRSPG